MSNAIKSLVERIRGFVDTDTGIAKQTTVELKGLDDQLAADLVSAAYVEEVALMLGAIPEAATRPVENFERGKKLIIDENSDREVQRLALIEVLMKIDEFSSELDVDASLKVYVLTGDTKQLINGLAQGNPDFKTVHYYLEKLTKQPSENATHKKLYQAITDLKKYGVKIEDKSVIQLATHLNLQLAEFDKQPGAKTETNKREFLDKFSKTVTTGSEGFDKHRNNRLTQLIGAIYKWAVNYFAKPEEKLQVPYSFFTQTTRRMKTDLVVQEAQSLVKPEDEATVVSPEPKV